MTRLHPEPAPGEPPVRPWYREPWPWVLIAIPAVAVIASLFTLYLALSNPEVIVLDVERYQEIRAGLRADPGEGGAQAVRPAPADTAVPAEDDGDR